MKIPLKEINGIRILSAGVSIVPANSTSVLDTQTLNGNEVIFPAVFITDDDNNAEWGFNDTKAFGPDYVGVFFRRSGRTNEFSLMANNTSERSNRTVQWVILAILPN